MIIGLDARTIGQKNITGVGQVVYHTVKALNQKNIKCILFYDEKPVFKLAEFKQEHIKQVVLLCKSRYIWEQVLLPLALKKYKPDLYHATWNLGLPLYLSCPAVVTIHDLIPLVLPNFFSTLKSKLFSYLPYKFFVRYSANKSNVVITDSISSRKDIERILKIPSEKIKVIYIGVNKAFKPDISPDLIHTVKEKYGIKQKYFIYLGGLDKRKNIQGIIKAFTEVLKLHQVYLVITGSFNDLLKELQLLAQSLNVAEKVVFTGYVPEEDLSHLLSGAVALVYPSYYEGFGIPPLEAMACGTPVIASNVSSIPEVVGEAGLLINPGDYLEIAKAMNEILINDNKRQQMIAEGVKRAQNFSWNEMGLQIVEVYKEILCKVNPR